MRNQAGSTAGQARFATAPSVEIQRSTFDRSFNHRTTFDEGQLIPFLVDEILPGDSVELNTTIVCRMATPKFPVMSMLYITTHFFFCPNRILFNNWAKLQGEEFDPGDDLSSFITPVVTSPVGGWTELSLGDYMGLPTLVDRDVNALPFRCYNRIYAEWYKDQDITDRPYTNTQGGPDPAVNYPVRYRCKPHDYFTSARPWPVKGGVQTTLALGGAAPVVPDSGGIPFFEGTTQGPTRLQFKSSQDETEWSSLPSATEIAEWNLTTGLEADLNSASGFTIESMRAAITMQQALELDGRSGTRYVEALRARWKVTSPDFRLQRPEYIGGGRQVINVTQVAMTNQTASDDLGQLGGFAYSAGSGHRASYTATEHGILMGIVSITGDNEYQEGIHKMWTRSTRFDYYEPIFANLGEQPILKMELFADGSATDLETWGYQERWSEYRYKPSIISGAFRSNAAQTLDPWHTAEELGSIPPLADEFIITSDESPNVNRVVITGTDPHFLFDSATRYRHTRAMPVYSVPGLTRL